MALCVHGCLFYMNKNIDNGGTITAIRVQERRKDRASVFLDGRFAFGLTLAEAARLRVGQALSSEDVAALIGRDSVERAHERALRFLTQRPRSVSEVRRSLERGKVPSDVSGQVIDRLQESGLVGDEEFAQFWVQNREQFRPRSKAALRMELRQKGVNDATIQRALQGVDDATAALAAARARARKLGLNDPAALRQKLIPFLLQRGFSYSTADDAYRQVQAEFTAESSNNVESEDY